MTEIDLARVIATTAHGALGQTRANGTSPYIVHPQRVVELLNQFCNGGTLLDPYERYDAIAAAWLHDVVEDTHLRLNDLAWLGISPETLNIVDRMTKPDTGPSQPSYYARIAEHLPTLVVKCADRCANLEDARAEILEHRELRRWRRYVEKTVVDVLPLYTAYPKLEAELEDRLEMIHVALAVAEAENRQCGAAAVEWASKNTFVESVPTCVLRGEHAEHRVYVPSRGVVTWPNVT